MDRALAAFLNVPEADQLAFIGSLAMPAATALHESIVESGATVTEAVWDALLDRSCPDDSAMSAYERVRVEFAPIFRDKPKLPEVVGLLVDGDRLRLRMLFASFEPDECDRLAAFLDQARALGDTRATEAKALLLWREP
jgi:hypothetical protein